MLIVYKHVNPVSMTVELLKEHHIVVTTTMTADITSSLLIPKQHALKELTESNLGSHTCSLSVLRM